MDVIVSVREDEVQKKTAMQIKNSRVSGKNWVRIFLFF